MWFKSNPPWDKLWFRILVLSFPYKSDLARWSSIRHNNKMQLNQTTVYNLCLIMMSESSLICFSLYYWVACLTAAQVASLWTARFSCPSPLLRRCRQTAHTPAFEVGIAASDWLCSIGSGGRNWLLEGKGGAELLMQNSKHVALNITPNIFN